MAYVLLEIEDIVEVWDYVQVAEGLVSPELRETDMGGRTQLALGAATRRGWSTAGILTKSIQCFAGMVAESMSA